MPSVTVKITFSGCIPSSADSTTLTFIYSSIVARWLVISVTSDKGTLIMLRLLE